MFDIIKKTILTGVGAAVVTREKVQNAFEDLVAQGKVSAADAKAMAERISVEGRKEFEDASAKASKQIHHLVTKGNEATQERLSQLEAKLKAMELRAKKHGAPVKRSHAKRAKPAPKKRK